MKLQTKLMVTLLAGVLGVVVLSQLAQGDMDKFTAMAATQGATRGVQELGLYNAQGIATYAAHTNVLGQALPADVRHSLLSSTNRLRRRTDTSFALYRPPSRPRPHPDTRVIGRRHPA